ncbi:Fc.00g114540.m01.CDS01 [Cosmosporella sp. VM-42]
MDLPAYTPTDNDGLFERVEKASALELPILRAPVRRLWYEMPGTLGEEFFAVTEAYLLQTDIINSFFSAIEAGHYDLVAQFISRGFVSPDTTNAHGETPLLAAVHAGNLPMVSKLVSLGATVDGYGRAKERLKDVDNRVNYPERTPLQYAAQRGNLALVRALMEDYGANDALIAPDGAMALRLAAVNGHREIVDYLPMRRGGAWLRWKTAHDKEMKAMRRALSSIKRFIEMFAWVIPKWLLYEVPRNMARKAWKRRHLFGGWCKRQITEFPRRAKKAAKKVWHGIKEIPRVIKELCQEFWKCLKAVPGAFKLVALWIGRGLKSVGTAIFDVVKRFFSFLHTALSAIASFFKGITLKDVLDAFSYVLQGIFLETPKAIWSFIAGFGKLSYKVAKATLGIIGQAVWCICVCILSLIIYIPKKLWRCLEAIGRTSLRGYQEGMAYLNPKRI